MDPLAQLKDIHLSEQIANYPIAPGWIIVFTLLLITAILLIARFIKHQKRCLAKKQALKQVANQALTPTSFINVTKWAAMQYFPRQEIASLHGEELRSFLMQCLPTKKQNEFKELIGDSLNNCYNQEEQACSQNVGQAAMLWLNKALPPKNLGKKQ